jgi:hypothetical protein
MSYVLIRSWHLIVGTDRGGVVRTRCGRRVAVQGTITSGGVGELVLHPTAPELPLGDRSCETCLRLAAHDEAQER